MNNAMTGKLIIFSAPSGSGKSTIINYLLTKPLNLSFSVSATSRAPRGNEKDGVEYFFLTPQEFRKRIENNEFLEYEEVYKDCYYGTLKSQVEKMLEEGKNVVLDVDVAGGCNIKKLYGNQALSIFIQPPSIEELRKRLTNRGTDAPEVIEKRIAKASYELGFAPKFDRVVTNDDLEKAKSEVLGMVVRFLRRQEYPLRVIRPMTFLSGFTGLLSLYGAYIGYRGYFAQQDDASVFLVCAIILSVITLRQCFVFPQWIRRWREKRRW